MKKLAVRLTALLVILGIGMAVAVFSPVRSYEKLPPKVITIPTSSYPKLEVARVVDAKEGITDNNNLLKVAIYIAPNADTAKAIKDILSIYEWGAGLMKDDLGRRGFVEIWFLSHVDNRDYEPYIVDGIIGLSRKEIPILLSNNVASMEELLTFQEDIAKSSDNNDGELVVPDNPPVFDGFKTQ